MSTEMKSRNPKLAFVRIWRGDHKNGEYVLKIYREKWYPDAKWVQVTTTEAKRIHTYQEVDELFRKVGVEPTILDTFQLFSDLLDFSHGRLKELPL